MNKTRFKDQQHSTARSSWLRVLKKESLLFTSLVLSGILLQGCKSGLGYQGGDIPDNFGGITLAQAVSPKSFQLTWETLKGATEYRVYDSTLNDPVIRQGFNSTIFSPAQADGSKVYQYSVTAFDGEKRKEVGNRNQYVSLRLLPRFHFGTTGSATSAGRNSIRISWGAYPTVNYWVYTAERSPTGLVSYNFSNPTPVSGTGEVTISGLQEGREYCAIVVARYLDETKDGPDAQEVTGDFSTVLSSNTYMVGPSGQFGDSRISTVQKCARTQSSFNISAIRIYSQKAQFSSTPTFYVYVPSDTTEDSTGPVNASVYRFNPTTQTSTLIGSRVGTGRITSSVSFSPGGYQFFGVIEDRAGTGAQDRKEINVGPTGTTPNSPSERPKIFVRALPDTESVSAPLGYYPKKQQAGRGSQRLGTSVASGDFNCDGKNDIAIGAPETTFVAADGRPSTGGKVIIYYSASTVGPNNLPSNTTEKQEITFDITALTGDDTSRHLRLGQKLYAGNFNNDHQKNNQNNSSGSEVFKCDDLAITSGYGALFVLYGKRAVGGSPGGLNYFNSNTFIPNPPSSCDPASNVCDPNVYYMNGYRLGFALGSGDFNGDHFEDLVVTTQNLQSQPMGTWVFRGSEYGLIPPRSHNVINEETITLPVGPKTGFPYIPINGAWASTFLDTTSDEFGRSVASFPNSYYDTKTKRIRDLLLIGNPSHGNNVGRVHLCRPTNSTGTATDDPNDGFVWDCANALRNPTSDGETPTTDNSWSNGRFGHAMTRIPNALRYQPDQFNTACGVGLGNCGTLTDTSNIKLGFPGAVAISSPNSTVAGVTTPRVTIFYGVSRPSGSSTTRDSIGTAITDYVHKLLTTQRETDGNTRVVISTGSNQPCRFSLINSFTEKCEIQQITHPNSTMAARGSFGDLLSAFPGNNTVTGASTTSQSKDTILAVTLPTTNVTLSGGITYSSVGSVQLYQQNSMFTTNPIRVTSASSCGTTEICRFSDGFSTNLTTTLSYDGVLGNNINFGSGGVVGRSLYRNSGGDDYSTNTDIIVGAPGYVTSLTVNSTNTNVLDNGAAMVYFSHGGTYRNYRTDEGNSNPSAWHTIDNSLSQESNLRFHHSISAGDVNRDGSGDILSRVSLGNLNKIFLTMGSTTSPELRRTESGTTEFIVQGDGTAGYRIVPIPNLTSSNGTGYFITSSSSSYLFFQSVSGLIQGVPSETAVGGAPRRFVSQLSRIPAGYSDLVNYMRFDERIFYNVESNGDLDTGLNIHANFAVGDFNGDGFNDFAFGQNSIDQIFNVSNSARFPAAGTTGRVFVFYGGASNGFQTQPDDARGYPLASTHMHDLSTSGSSFGPQGPCQTATGTNCKIQMIAESSMVRFGRSIASVPAGTCNGKAVHALVVHGVNNSNNNRLYVYKPRCLVSASDLGGLNSISSSSSETVLEIPTGPYLSSTGFATTMLSVSGIMGNAGSHPHHLLVSDPSTSAVIIYPVNPGNTGSLKLFDISGSGFSQTTDFIAKGGRILNYSGTNLISGQNTAWLGVGMAAIGDANGDGFQDVAINVARATRKEVSLEVAMQGVVMTLFGGPSGLQTHSNASYTVISEPSKSAQCFLRPASGGGSIESICPPSLLSLPQPSNSSRNGLGERTYLSPYSTLSFGTLNENFPAFIIGTPGRDSLDSNVNDRILSGGAYYVVP